MRKACLAIVLIGCGSSGGAGTCRSSSECSTGQACLDGHCVATVDSGGRDSGLIAQLDAQASDGPMCVATEMPEHTCNGLDDDCNHAIDDVDVGNDGICDCLRIGVIGDPGPNASSSFQAWLEERGTSVQRFGLDDAPLTLAQLRMFDVVILDRLRREYTTEESAILHTFVEQGGGVMSMTGHDGGSDLPRGNSLLASFGVQYIAGLHNGPITQWDAHPISMGISSVTFLGGYLIDAASSVPVAHLDGGVVGVAQEIGMGRIFVWGDEWIEYDSEWTTMPQIAQLWANMLGWLGPRDRCAVLI